MWIFGTQMTQIELMNADKEGVPESVEGCSNIAQSFCRAAEETP